LLKRGPRLDDPPRAPLARRRPQFPVRDLAAILVTAGSYYAGARIGLLPALVRGQVTPFWPPTGIAVVCLMVLGLRTVPGIAIASFAVNLPLGPTLPAVVGIAAGNTIAPVVAVLALRAFGVSSALGRLRDGVLFVSVAVGSMTISASMGTGMLRLAGAARADQVWRAWAVWWAGDAMGVLVVAPVLLHLWRMQRMRRWQALPSGRLLEGVAMLALVAVVMQYAVTRGSPAGVLICPLLVWAAFRFRQLGAALVALEACVFASATAAGKHGAFGHGGLVHSMLILQLFNASIALTGLLLAAAVTQLDRSRRELALANLLLSRRVEQRGAELDRGRSRIAVLADRHWISTQLHDTVLQRLFGLGIALESAAATGNPADRQRLARVIDDLDAVVNDLALAIYQVEDDAPTTSFHEAIDHVIAAATHPLGLRPTLVLSGDDEQIPLALRTQLLATLHEALSDLAARTGTRHIDITITITGGETGLTISADHAGRRPADAQPGLRRATERARRLGGTCEWQTSDRRSTLTLLIPTG
jgi:integral membrane sensor domain MASE1